MLKKALDNIFIVIEQFNIETNTIDKTTIPLLLQQLKQELQQQNLQATQTMAKLYPYLDIKEKEKLKALKLFKSNFY